MYVRCCICFVLFVCLFCFFSVLNYGVETKAPELFCGIVVAIDVTLTTSFGSFSYQDNDQNFINLLI